MNFKAFRIITICCVILGSIAVIVTAIVKVAQAYNHLHLIYK